MHQPIISHFDDYTLFLLVRRGVPILGIALLMPLARLNLTGRVLCLVGVIIILAEVGLTFKCGNSYLKYRQIIIRQDKFWVNILRPIARCLNMESTWILSFCHWNNHLVQQAFQDNKSTRTLLLLPHCIQAISCSANIMEDLNQCHKCGLCTIGKILTLKKKYGWQHRVANRSHKAYKEAEEYRPDLVIAISCLDRLFKGITKLSSVPAYVIPLVLSHGMCVNTHVNVTQLIAIAEKLVE